MTTSRYFSILLASIASSTTQHNRDTCVDTKATLLKTNKVSRLSPASTFHCYITSKLLNYNLDRPGAMLSLNKRGLFEIKGLLPSNNGAVLDASTLFSHIQTQQG